MACIHAYLASGLPSMVRGLSTVTVLETLEAPSEKPDLVFVQLSQDETIEKRLQLACQLAQAKIPLALLDAAESHLPLLKKLAQTAHRNRVPVVLMGSFRFIPAVAALKEMAVSGVLGTMTHAFISASDHLAQHPMNRWRLIDAAQWCGSMPPEWQLHTSELDTAIVLQGTNGKATASFSLDGQLADFTLETVCHVSTCSVHEVKTSGYKAACTHHRVLPSADPALSELAILIAELEDDTRLTKKIKSMPMMMELLPTLSTT